MADGSHDDSCKSYNEGSNHGTPGTGNPDMPDTGQGTSVDGKIDATNNQLKGNKFQQAVRRHLGKDKLFHLVTTLLKSIEEERRAQNDLIMSFETARNIKIDIPGADRHGNDLKPKRRRKKMETSLADKIELQRKSKSGSNFIELKEHVSKEETVRVDEMCELGTNESIIKAETSEVIVKSEIDEIVGELELTANNKGQLSENTIDRPDSTPKEDSESVTDQNNAPIKLPFAKVKVKAETAIKNGRVKQKEKNEEDSEIVTDKNKITIDGNKQRNLPRSALTSEKEVVVEHFRSIDDNFDLNKLVLDSVLENTCLVNNSNTETGNTKEHGKEGKEAVVENATKDEKKGPEIQVIVEADGDESTEESDTDVIGKSDGLEDSFDTIEPKYQDTSKERDLRTDNTCFVSEKECFGKFLANKQSVTSSEFDRMPCTLMKPTLNTIEEAERSFNSLYGSSSNSIIEIETNKTNLDKCTRPLNFSEMKQNKPEVKVKLPRKCETSSRIQEYSERNNANVSPETRPSRILCIDLLGVYEGNKDLQNIQFGGEASKPKMSKVRPSTYSNNRKSKSSKSNNSKSASVPGSPKSLPMYPKSVKISDQCPRSRLSVETSTHPSSEHIQQFRSYIIRQDTERYRKPDMVLWSHLSILETKPKHIYPAETKKYKQSESFVNADRQSWRSRSNHGPDNSGRIRPRSCLTRQHAGNFSMPLKEAVESVSHVDKSKLPRIKAIGLHEGHSREKRVKQLYSNFQNDRIESGYRQCKYLDLSPRMNADILY